MKRFWVMLVLPFVLFWSVPTARSNGLPVRWSPSPAGEVIGVETEVILEHEQLSLSVQESLDEAVASVRYVLANPTERSEDLCVAFFATSADAPRVAYDGKPVDVRPAEPEEAAALTTLVDPQAGRISPVWFFDITVEPGARASLLVEYEQVAGWDDMKCPNRVYTYHYRLVPAKQWARVGEIEISVDLPLGTELVGTDIPGVELAAKVADSGRAVHTAFVEGKPDLDLTFGVTSFSGAWLGRKRQVYNTMLWAFPGALSLLAASAAARFARLPSSFYNSLLGAALGLTGGVLGALGGYWLMKTVIPVRVFTDASPLLWMLFLPVMGGILGVVVGPGLVFVRNLHNPGR